MQTCRFHISLNSLKDETKFSQMSFAGMPPEPQPQSQSSEQPEFIESATFAGPKAGYNFKMGPSGMGYYKEDGNQTAVAAPTQQVMALHEDGVDKESVRKCGPLPFGSAMAYAKAIPPDQRSVTGCYMLKCPGGTCVGYSYNVDCNGYLWTPCCLILPFCRLLNTDADGFHYTQDMKTRARNMFLYEVDSDTHTLALYSAACGDWMSATGPSTPCLYCVR